MSKNMKEIDYGMSNYDYSIDDGMGDVLMSDPGLVFGRHHGWNFNGRVYFDGEKYHEEVWVRHELMETISAGSLNELMEKVNIKYGYD